MTITREMKDAVNRRLRFDGDYLTDEGYAFYHRCLFEYGLHWLDTDAYAALNILIGYDIGVDSAMKIISYLYDRSMTTIGMDGNDESKAEIQKAIDALNLDVSLDNWQYGDVVAYAYYKEG